MAKKTEWIKARVEPSVKHSIDKIPEANSKFLRDILQRELDRRELMKDEKKKEAPALVERLKELNTEINSLEDQVSKRRSRLKEVQKSLDAVESELSKKRGLKDKLMDEMTEKTSMDELEIKMAVGDGQ